MYISHQLNKELDDIIRKDEEIKQYLNRKETLRKMNLKSESELKRPLSKLQSPKS